MIDLKIVDEVFRKKSSITTKKQLPNLIILESPMQINLVKILDDQGPLTRRELVIQLNTPRTTIYDNLIKLQKRKIVEKFTRKNGTRGRPLVYWKIKE